MTIGPHRVQVMKQESAALGGDATDETEFGPSPIEPLEDAPESAGGYVQAPSETRDQTVGWYRHNGEYYVFDQQNVGRSLSQLLGLDLRTCYKEVTRSSGQVTAIIVWTNSGKTQKVKETLITYSSGVPSVVVEKHYNKAGTVHTGGTFTKTLTRTSGQVTSIDVVQS